MVNEQQSETGLSFSATLNGSYGSSSSGSTLSSESTSSESKESSISGDGDEGRTSDSTTSESTTFDHKTVSNQETDSIIVRVREHHNTYPPRSQTNKCEDRPATANDLTYFRKIIELKTTNYHNLLESHPFDELREIPLAHDYETFFLHYWPGRLRCCQKLFSSSKSFSFHFNILHKPSLTKSSQLSLSVVDAASALSSESDMEDSAVTPARSTKRQTNNTPSSSTRFNSSVNDVTVDESRKRKKLSPSSKPGPKSRKQAKITEFSSINNNSTVLSSSSLLVDSSTESGMEDRPADETTSVRPKKAFKLPRQNNNNNNNSLAPDLDESEMVKLEKDQMMFPPQHEPGRPEDFPATESRIKYFNDVLALKYSKYAHINSFKPENSTIHHIPLALSIAGFAHYYWPGRVLCCGVLRKTINELEKHIRRAHRPPKPSPVLTLPVENDGNGRDSDVVPEHSSNTDQSTSRKDDANSLLDVEIDQNQYLPQHRPSDPENFKANEESIRYFLEVLALKREKYSHLNEKSGEEAPLKLSLAECLKYYWPGVLNCCDTVYATSDKFVSHISAVHGPKGKPLKPTVLTGDIPEASSPEIVEADDPSPSSSVLSVPQQAPTNTGRRGRNAAAASSSSSQRPRPTSPMKRRSDRSSIDDRLDQTIPTSLSLPDSVEVVFEEARKLRRQLEQVSSLEELMPLLVRILELAAALTDRLRAVRSSDRDGWDDRANQIEALEYIWNASKNAIVRWESIKGQGGPRDVSLAAVKYAYSSLPIFTNWDQPKDLDDVGNVAILTLNTVRRWPCPSASSPLVAEEEKKKNVRGPSRRSLAVVKQEKVSPERASRRRSTSDATPAAVDDTVIGPTPPKGPKKDNNVKDLKALAEFCRHANIAISQNTRNRASTSYRDDDGNFHAMYRYGISQILKLYCPTWVTHLKCCDRTFDLSTLRVHVLERHEAPGASGDRTDSSIAPA